MDIRSIAAQELERYLTETEFSGDIERFRTFFLRQWETGESKPEWFFVAEVDGRFVGRLNFWKIGEESRQFFLSALYFSQHYEDRLQRVIRFLNGAVQDLNTTTIVNEIECHDRNSQYDDILIQALQNCGFQLQQEKYRLTNTDPRVMPLGRCAELREESLTNVGHTAFIEYIRLVTESTLDRNDTYLVAKYGGDTAATQYFDFLRELDYDPELWTVLHDAKKNVIGIVVPQKIGDALGTIGYIGVAPKFRGQGYGKCLLNIATKKLLNAGVRKMIVDTDVQNAPVLAHLRAFGYVINYRDDVWVLRS